MKNFFLRRKLNKGKLVEIGNEVSVNDYLPVLTDIALKNNFAIVVGNQTRADMLLYTEVTVLRLAQTFTKEVLNNNQPLLVDDSIGLEMLNWLKSQGKDIRGGVYRRNDNNGK
ncbi:hypothetical protein Q7A53_05060 [Halobacillus rhizosphaerae]|uniref:hypothetical protein n=1 Tax=Halobacillus rhizosphaerae TaxID=3064889 RepID=UPI00398A635E